MRSSMVKETRCLFWNRNKKKRHTAAALFSHVTITRWYNILSEPSSPETPPPKAGLFHPDYLYAVSQQCQHDHQNSSKCSSNSGRKGTVRGIFVSSYTA
jgi:hypothetical protein